MEPKTYQTQYDDTKPSSYQKVIQQGKAGQKKSTIRITRINGEVTEEKEVDKEIIQEAVPKSSSREHNKKIAKKRGSFRRFLLRNPLFCGNILISKQYI